MDFVMVNFLCFRVWESEVTLPDNSAFVRAVLGVQSSRYDESRNFGTLAVAIGGFALMQT